MLTQTQSAASAEISPSSPELNMLAQAHPEVESQHYISHTLEYLRPTNEELTFASGLVAQVEETTLVSECKKLMTESDDTTLVEHSYRVAIASTILGNRLGLSREELFLIATAAECHDVGKTDKKILAVESSNERYEGAAREKAMKIIERHVDVGAEIIRAFGIDSVNTEKIVEIERAHHSFSRVNDYGIHPKRFEKAAEAMAFADELDALASARQYKEAFDEAKTRSLLEKQFSGKLDLIGLCFDYPAQNYYTPGSVTS